MGFRRFLGLWGKKNHRREAERATGLKCPPAATAKDGCRHFPAVGQRKRRRREVFFFSTLCRPCTL